MSDEAFFKKQNDDLWERLRDRDSDIAALIKKLNLAKEMMRSVGIHPNLIDQIFK